jgi:AcrR family transcriptional regulator
MATPNALRRNQKSHQAILAASLDLCAERGYGDVTVEAIAGRAGVSKKTIYRWWPTKGAVVLEALHAWREDALTIPDTGDIFVDLEAQLELLRDFMTGPHGGAYTGLIAESQHDARLAHDLADQFIRPRNEVTLARLRAAQERNQVPVDADLPLLVERLYGPIHYRILLHLGPYSRSSIRSLITETLGPRRTAAGGA